MDEEATAARNIDVTKLKIRSRNWIYARSTEPSGSNLKFDKPETQEAVSRIAKAQSYLSSLAMLNNKATNAKLESAIT